MEINNVGSQAPTNLQDQAIGTEGGEQSVKQLAEAAETASASLFFSLLQNILGEAQSNSGS